MARTKIIHLAALFSCMLMTFNGIHTASIVGSKRSETIAYLKTFGYLPEATNNENISDELLRVALKKFQHNGHIPETEEIDDDTINLMQQPRCGVPDNFPLSVNHHRTKRYDTLSSKWHKLEITWNLDAKPFEKDETKIKNAIREAFNIWTEHSVLTFTEVKKHDDADIRISFQKSFHDNLDPYELKGTTLAHAFQPGPGIHGDAHYKIDVNWDFDVLADEKAASGKTSFFSVALHELGHSIGLGHSADLDAVMYEYSLGAGKLSKDDIKGIQFIYGVPKTTSLSPSTDISYDETEEEDDRPIWDTRPLEPKSEYPDHCLMAYDAIATLRKELFIFRGKYFWRPESSDRKPVEIHQYFSGLPSNLTHVDAVYENNDGKILFFVHQKLYIFEWRQLEKQIPYAGIGLDADIKSIDMIFEWPYNSVVYLFSGDYYWRYDTKFNVIMRNTKRLIRKAFKDVYDTDTAYVMNKKLYFFKGLYHYEFNDKAMTLERMRPFVSASVFMGCDLPKEPPKEPEIVNRFGDPSIDEVIDIGGLELPEDLDNPEKVVQKNEPDHAAAIEIFILTIFASLLISQMSSSILL